MKIEIKELSLSDALAFYVLNDLPSEVLPELAVKYLENDYDSESLRVLAGVENPEMSEVSGLLDSSLEEIGETKPDVNEAAFMVTKYFARKIIDKSISPYDGAKEIWQRVYDHLDEPAALDNFIGYASEIEDIPGRTAEDGIDRADYKQECENAIITTAEKFLELKEANEIFKKLT